ncbi:lasso RiPP family leader peptide-containing protein [Glaciihabitans sp. UYNi722]
MTKEVSSMGKNYEKPAMVKVGNFTAVTNATRNGNWFDFVIGYYWF